MTETQSDAQFDHTELRDFAARHSLIVNEAQDQFAALVQDAPSWQFDPFAGQLILGDREFAAQLLGSHAYESDTWLWAWGNSAYETDELRPVTAAARWLRDESPDRERAWQVRTPVFPLGEQLHQGGVAGWPLLYAAFIWLGARATYTGDYGQGRLFLTIHDEQLPWPKPDAITLPRLLTDTVAGTGLGATPLVECYAAHHRLDLQRTGAEMRLAFPNGSVVSIQTDEYDRPVSIKSALQ